MQTKYTIFFCKWLALYKLFNARSFAMGQALGNNAFPHETIIPKPFESRSFLNRGNWYPSILNWLSGKLVSSLISSIQSIFILDVEIIYL